MNPSMIAHGQAVVVVGCVSYEIMNRHQKYNSDAPLVLCGASAIRFLVVVVGCVRYEILNRHKKYNTDAPLVGFGASYQFRLRRNNIEETAVPCPYN